MQIAVSSDGTGVDTVEFYEEGFMLSNLVRIHVCIYVSHHSPSAYNSIAALHCTVRILLHTLYSLPYKLSHI